MLKLVYLFSYYTNGGDFSLWAIAFKRLLFIVTEKDKKGTVSNIQDQYKLLSSITCWAHGSSVANTSKLSRTFSYYVIFNFSYLFTVLLNSENAASRTPPPVSAGLMLIFLILIFENLYLSLYWLSIYLLKQI